MSHSELVTEVPTFSVQVFKGDAEGARPVRVTHQDSRSRHASRLGARSGMALYQPGAMPKLTSKSERCRYLRRQELLRFEQGSTLEIAASLVSSHDLGYQAYGHRHSNQDHYSLQPNAQALSDQLLIRTAWSGVTGSHLDPQSSYAHGVDWVMMVDDRSTLECHSLDNSSKISLTLSFTSQQRDMETNLRHPSSSTQK